MASCSAEGCEHEARAKGFCTNHYARAWRQANKERARITDRKHYHRNIIKERAAQNRRYHSGGGKEKAKIYNEINGERISLKRKALRTPTDLDGWARHVRHKTIVNASGRKLKNKDCGGGLPLEWARRKVDEAHANGDVDFHNPICAPSPDRICNKGGYREDNVEVIPQWLNFAYHTWDKKEVEAAILKWAARRLLGRQQL